MRVTVVGAGYVGLVSAAGFAEIGNTVTCVDRSPERVDALRRGIIPIVEPGLDALVARNAADGRVAFTTDLPAALREADAIFVCVGTPMREDGAADLGQVEAVARSVVADARQPCVLVLKSTVPVGTHRRVSALVAGAAVRVRVVSNPEFLKEGDAVQDFLRPDRIVVGVPEGDEDARAVMRRLYHPLCLDRERVIWMDPASAELTKYAANAMLALRISFMNEMAALCEAVGADVHRVRHGVGSDPRIGPQFLYAGPGYGGSCLPKDVNALLYTAGTHGVTLELAAAADRVNARQKGLLLRKVRGALGGSVSGRRVAVWGVAFKARTDDIRESAALPLIDGLLAEGATVALHDPEAMPHARARYGERVICADDPYAAADGADALVLVTEWRPYQSPDFARLRTALRQPILIDGRNLWSSYGLAGQGFQYEGIGVRSA